MRGQQPSDAAGGWLVIATVAGIFLFAVWDTDWFTKWRYYLTSDIPAAHVFIDSQPHDCDFLTAPLGQKNCHYERVVQKETLEGAPSIYVSWKKVQD